MGLFRAGYYCELDYQGTFDRMNEGRNVDVRLINLSKVCVIIEHHLLWIKLNKSDPADNIEGTVIGPLMKYKWLWSIELIAQ